MRANVPFDDHDRHRLILRIVAQLRCAECGRPYNPHGLVLLQQMRGIWVLSIECEHCHSSSYVIVAMQMEMENGSATAYRGDPPRTAELSPPLTSDDVLEMHELLEEHDGDMWSLLRG